MSYHADAFRWSWSGSEVRFGSTSTMRRADPCMRTRTFTCLPPSAGYLSSALSASGSSSGLFSAATTPTCGLPRRMCAPSPRTTWAIVCLKRVEQMSSLSVGTRSSSPGREMRLLRCSPLGLRVSHPMGGRSLGADDLLDAGGRLGHSGRVVESLCEHIG